MDGISKEGIEMITANNIHDVIRTIDIQTLEDVMLDDGDHVILEMHLFKTGVGVGIQSSNFSWQKSMKAEEDGSAIIEKDQFAQLISECGK